MHANIVPPALSLLHGWSNLVKVKQAFQKALGELKPNQDPGDAITDAGTALQIACDGGGVRQVAKAPLLNDAKKNGLLRPDSKLAQGVEFIDEWVSADRSNRGNAHAASDATRADGWLAAT